MSGKIPLAVIGCGIIGEIHITNYADDPNAEVAAICDINEERLNFIGDKYGIARRFTHIGKLLREQDIVAVDVCLHNNLHAPVAIAALEAGKDVYCEKPMAGTFADARAMYEARQRTGRRLHIQLSRLYTDESKAAKRIIDAGRLGHLYHMRSYGFRRRGRPYVDGYATQEFVNTVTAGGGALFDMGVYHISQLLYLAGAPELERVTGRTYAEIAMDEKRRAISGFNVEELGCGFATYAGGLTMDILESWAIHARPFPSSILCGSEGGLSLSPLTFHFREQDLEADLTVDLKVMKGLDHSVYADSAFYDSSQKHWTHVLAGHCPQIDTPKIAFETQKVQEGIYLATRLGREVSAVEIGERSVSRALEIPNLAL
jgi:predicted dehydrogenase